METSRRVFLGSSLTAMPLAAHWWPWPAEATGTSTDIVLDHIARELARIINLCRSTGSARGEHLRTVAANLRLLSSHAKDTGTAARADTAVGRSIRERGRAAIAAEAPSGATLRRLHEHVTAAGVAVSLEDFRRALPSDDVAGRERALEQLQRRGTAGLIADVAATIESIARNVDGRGPDGVLVRVRQLDEACYQLSWQLLVLEASAVAMAIVAPYAAAQLAMAALFIRFYMSLQGCP